MNKSFLCVLLLLTVAPATVGLALLSLAPERFDGPPTLLKIIGMIIFAWITVPMWPTYIPAIIFAPRLMKAMARKPAFWTMRWTALLGKSMALGAGLGALVVTPVLLLCLCGGQIQVTFIWGLSGAIAGAVTLSLMVLVYRRDEQPEEDGPQNSPEDASSIN